MGDLRKLVPITVAAAATGSLGATFTSDPLPVNNFRDVAVQAVISGSALLNGALSLQASCDAGGDPSVGPASVTGVTNWTDIPSSSQTVTGDGTTIWNCSAIAYRFLRVVFTRTAGSGVCTITANGKEG